MATKTTGKVAAGKIGHAQDAAEDVRELVLASPELALTKVDGLLIHEFLAGVERFFQRATELEVRAKATLARAQRLTAPLTLDADLAIQAFIKEANVDRREIDALWGITSTVWTLHKRLVAARQRGVTALESAATVAQRLHNAYVETERRRAAEEQDRLRRQAEAAARQARDSQLREREAAAIAAEESAPNLSEREECFVESYVEHSIMKGNACQCAANAGYQDAFKSAARLIASSKIQAAIRARQEAIAIREQAHALAAMPIEVEVPTVTPEVARASGSFDRTTWSAELLSPDALVNAVFEGTYGIPRDVLMPNPVKLNEHARSLHELLDRWPGVRAKKSTKTV